ncbi:hypothetical protein PHISP_05207 [Aspergillus sp. HF37]|nr:hypothetical protein PHISP_05207 [Aspergillus sp. HF37]
MAPDAILVSDDSQNTSTVLYQRETEKQTRSRKRTISQPERFYGSNSVSSPVNPQPAVESKPLPSKRRSYVEWMGNMVENTFRRSRGDS